MQNDDWRWLVGQAIIVLLAFIGQHVRLAARIDKKTDELHARVNEVRDNYVKTSDLDKNLQRIDGSVSEMRREMHAMQEALAKKMDEMTKTIIETRVETAKLNGHKAAD